MTLVEALDPSLVDALGTVTASAALWAARELQKIRQETERHGKLLEGFEDSEAYDGLIPQVQRHEEVLEQEGLL